MDTINPEDIKDEPIILETPPEPNIKLKIANGLYYQYNGEIPNWFHRTMQYLIFGFEYKRINNE